MTRLIYGVLLLTLVAIATAGTIAGGITGRQLVSGKAGDVVGSAIDISVEVIDAIQAGLAKVGGGAPEPAPAAPAPAPGA